MTATAAWSTRDLYASLGHNGWGVLDEVIPGVRKVLEALVYQLPYGSGEGRVTVAQIARWAHLSDRWTRRCLYQLEAFHIITWKRGYVLKGKAVPSIIRINKRALVQIIRHTAERWRAALAAKKHREADRVANLGTLRPRHHRNTPSHPVPALSAYLPSHKGGDPQASPPPEHEDEEMKHPCIHGMPDINGCGMCRLELRHNPDLDVTTLWATDEQQQQRDTARRGRELCRQAVRLAQQAQDQLS